MTEEMKIEKTLELRAELAKRLAKITNEIGAMTKDGENKEFKYFFISYEQMNAHLRTLLPANGVEIIPEVDSIDEKHLDGKDGKKFFRSVVTMKFLIIDTETGFEIERKFSGGSNDNGDKSIGKAITETTKRFYFKLFHVSSMKDRDPDEESGDPDDGKKEPAPKAPRKEAPAADAAKVPEEKKGAAPAAERTYEKEALKTAADAAAAMDKAEAAAKAAAELKAAKIAAKKEIAALELDPLKEVNAYAAKIGKALAVMTAADYRNAVEWVKGGGK